MAENNMLEMKVKALRLKHLDHLANALERGDIREDRLVDVEKDELVEMNKMFDPAEQAWEANREGAPGALEEEAAAKARSAGGQVRMPAKVKAKKAKEVVGAPRYFSAEGDKELSPEGDVIGEAPAEFKQFHGGSTADKAAQARDALEAEAPDYQSPDVAAPIKAAQGLDAIGRSALSPEELEQATMEAKAANPTAWNTPEEEFDLQPTAAPMGNIRARPLAEEQATAPFMDQTEGAVDDFRAVPVPPQNEAQAFWEREAQARQQSEALDARKELVQPMSEEQAAALPDAAPQQAAPQQAGGSQSIKMSASGPSGGPGVKSRDLGLTRDATELETRAVEQRHEQTVEAAKAEAQTAATMNEAANKLAGEQALIQKQLAEKQVVAEDMKIRMARAERRMDFPHAGPTVSDEELARTQLMASGGGDATPAQQKAARAKLSQWSSPHVFDKSVFGRGVSSALGVIAAALGAYGSAITKTPNFALQMLNKNLDDHNQRVRMEKGAAREEVERLTQLDMDNEDDMRMLKQLQMQQIGKQIDILKAKSGSVEQQAKYDELAANLVAQQESMANEGVESAHAKLKLEERESQQRDRQLNIQARGQRWSHQLAVAKAFNAKTAGKKLDKPAEETKKIITSGMSFDNDLEGITKQFEAAEWTDAFTSWVPFSTNALALYNRQIDMMASILGKSYEPRLTDEDVNRYKRQLPPGLGDKERGVHMLKILQGQTRARVAEAILSRAALNEDVEGAAQHYQKRYGFKPEQIVKEWRAGKIIYKVGGKMLVAPRVYGTGDTPTGPEGE